MYVYSDEYYIKFCYTCGRKTEHDRCTGKCVKEHE